MCDTAGSYNYDPIPHWGRAIISQGQRRNNQAMIARTKNSRVQAEVIMVGQLQNTAWIILTTVRSRRTAEAEVHCNTGKRLLQHRIVNSTINTNTELPSFMAGTQCVMKQTRQKAALACRSCGYVMSGCESCIIYPV